MKRVIAVLAAVVLALVGAFSVTAYARSADTRAVAEQEPTQVYISTAAVPAGTTAQEAFDQGLVVPSMVAAKGVPEGALVEIDPASTDVAVSDIAPAEMLLAARFGAEPEVTDALVVPEGQVAVTVQLSDPGRVSAFLRPGSEIAVYETFEVRDPEAGELVPGGAALSLGGDVPDVNGTRVLLPRATILAVGAVTVNGAAPAPGADPDAPPSDAAPAEQAVPQALVTLATSPVDAQRLVHGAQTGLLYAGLLGENTTVEDLTVEDRQLFADKS